MSRTPGAEAAAIAPLLVARLALGSRRPVPEPGNPEDFAAVVDTLRASRIPLADVRESGCPDLAWLFGSAPYRRLLLEHRRRRDDFEREFGAFLERATAAALPVLVLKACDTFPYEGSNLDLLVPPERMSEAADLLSRIGFIALRHYREPHKTLHKKIESGRDVATFHLHEEVSWDGAIFLERAALWARCRPLPGHPGVHQLHPADLVALTVAHAVHENGALRVAELARILRALAAGPCDPVEVLEVARRHRWSRGLRLGLAGFARMEFALAGTSSVAERFGAPVAPGAAHPPGIAIDLGRWRARRLLLGTMLRATMAPGARLRLAGRYLAGKVRAACRVPAHRGLLVALSGVDGAGKSFYSDRLIRDLRACDFHVTRVWARGGSSRTLLRLKALARRAAPGAESIATRPAGEALAHGWQRALWPWAVAFDLLLSLSLRVVPPLLARRVVVCDRHLLDAAVDMSVRLAGSDPRRLVAWRLLVALTPAPKLHVLLDAAPEAVLKRKDPGMARADLERRRDLYHHLADARMTVVDTDRDAELVGDEIGRLVIAAVGRRAT